MLISLKLTKDFENCLEDLKKEFGEDFEYINGIHSRQLDFSEFLNNFVDKDTMADATIDPNSNANHKDIRSFMTEKAKSEDKLFGLNKIFLTVKKMWGLKTAKYWLRQEFSKGFYLNDSASASYYPYCWANDLTKLATEGLFFLKNYNKKAPKHLTTYFDDVIEFVSFLSNRQSGAVGLPNVLIWAYYFWKKDVADNYYTRDPQTYLRQNFQKFIYRLNQPFLRIDQCAFTNVSIFDRRYLESLFGGVIFPDGTLVIDCIEELIEIQKIFMEVVSDIREEQMFTFPILTFSLLYSDETFQDEEFARWASTHNMKWSDSNFFISDNVGVLSNCCFGGDQEFYYYDKNGERILTTFKNFVEERLTKKYINSQIIDKVANEHIIDPNTGKKAEIKAVSKLPNETKQLIEIEFDNGQIVKVTPDQKLFDKKSGKLVTAAEILKSPESYEF